MDFDSLWENILDFYHDYTLIAIGLGVVLLLWAWFKPKQATKAILFAAFVAAVFYVLGQIREGTGSGLSQKETMIHKTERALGE